MHPAKHLRTAAAFVAGILVAGTLAWSQGQIQRLGSVMKITLPRQQEAREIIEADTTFATFDTELQYLPLLVPDNHSTVGRYQAVPLEGVPEFLILDTQTGIARHFTENQKVVVYSAAIPNHAITQIVRVHDAFEAVTRREVPLTQP